MGYIIGLMGMWLFCDAWFSLALYIGKDGQSWGRDHFIRIIRMLIGIMLMIMGWQLR